jgi:hypothetical protein
LLDSFSLAHDWCGENPGRLPTSVINIDAAFDVESKSGASGAIMRNSQGNFIAASSVFIPYVASATMTEAMAMLHGLNFANSLGYSEVEAESDSLEVVQLCSGEDRIWNGSIAIYANIIDQAGEIGKVFQALQEGGKQGCS